MPTKNKPAAENDNLVAIVEQNAFLKAILESSVDFAIVTAGLDGNVTSWNEGAYHVLGWTKAEMIGLPAATFFTPEDTARGVPELEMKACVTNGRAEDERWHLRKDHTRFWANGLMMPLRDEDNRHIGYLKILRDRTDQRRMQDDLRESETRNRLALAAANLGIWETDLDLGQVVWDQRTRDLFGIAGDEPLNYELSFLQNIHADDRDAVHRRISAVISGSADDLFDMEFRTTTDRWVHATGRVVERRETKRLMGTVREVTAQKEAEQQQDLLTGELQHRIKNTLAMVQSIVSQSLRTAETPAAASATIAQRLITLSKAHDLLTENSWSAAPIGEIVSGATQFQRADVSRIHITGPDISLGPKPALGLTLALHELCTNAAKYGALSVQGGHVAIDWTITGEGDARRLEFSWQEQGGPPVIATPKKGFGARLIENSLGNQGNIEAKLQFEPDGVKWNLKVLLTAVQ